MTRTKKKPIRQLRRLLNATQSVFRPLRAGVRRCQIKERY